MVLPALRCAEDRDLRGSILLQREGHGLIERQTHHACGRRSRQRALLHLALRLSQGRRQGRDEQQAEQCYIKNDVRAFLVRLLAALFGSGDFLDGCLVQASLRYQVPTLAADLLQQRLSRGINKADATEVDGKLFGRGSGSQFAPALLYPRNEFSRQAPLYVEEALKP